MPKHLIASIASLVLPFGALAQEKQSIEPGSYFVQGSAELLISADASKKQLFSISSTGGNLHSCQLGGEIDGTQGRARDANGPLCVVNFRTERTGIIVEAISHEACRDYCGARAGFEGTYLKGDDSCASPEVSKARSAFKTFYDQKDYQQAQSTLTPLLARCTGTLHVLLVNDVRNDLAITQYHLSDFSGCLSTLKPVRAFYNGEPGLDAEELRLVKIALFNRKLCSDALTSNANN